MSEDKTGAQQNPNETGSAKSILDNSQVFKLLMDAIDRRVNTQFQARFDRFRNGLIGVLTIAVILGTAVGGILLKNVAEDTAEDAVGPAVEKAVGSAVEKAVAGVQFDAQVAALNFRVLNIELAEGFNRADASSIVAEIESLYSQRSDATSRVKLRFAIETAAKNFAQMNWPEFVYQLEEIDADLLQTSDIVLQAMIQVLGNRLLADSDAPSSWSAEGSSMMETYERYRRYADRAKSTGYPELYLAYELLLRFVGRGAREEITNLIKDTSSLSSQDADIFVRHMVQLAGGGLGITGSNRIASRAKDFLCQFKEQGQLLLTASKTAELQCP